MEDYLRLIEDWLEDSLEAAGIEHGLIESGLHDLALELVGVFDRTMFDESVIIWETGTGPDRTEMMEMLVRSGALADMASRYLEGTLSIREFVELSESYVTNATMSRAVFVPAF